MVLRIFGMKLNDIKFINEAISVRDQISLRNTGFKVLDAKEYGLFNLALIRMPMKIEGINLQLGFSKDDTSFTDYSQHQKIPTTNCAIKDAFKFKSEAKEQISRWLNTHGKLLVISSNEERTQQYFQLLAKLGFKVELKRNTDFDINICILTAG